jgi:hypothetical protein
MTGPPCEDHGGSGELMETSTGEKNVVAVFAQWDCNNDPFLF